MNQPLLGKQALRIITEPRNLMASTLLSKYYKEKSFIDTEPKLEDT